MSLYFDAAETFWQDWVLNYDLDHQLLLASRMQDSTSRGATLDRYGDDAPAKLADRRVGLAEALRRSAGGGHHCDSTAGCSTVRRCCICGVPASASAACSAGQVDSSDATLLYRRMLRVLERRGYERPAWVTPGEFARTLPASELSPLVEDLTEAYQELRYGNRREAGPRMLTLLERLEQLG